MPERDLTGLLKSAPQSQSLWDRWFRAIYPRVYYSLFRVTGGNRVTAQDLTQGAMERFIRYGGLKRVSTDEESVAYLVTSGRRLYAQDAMSQTQEVSVPEVKGLPDEDTDKVRNLLDIEALLDQLSDGEQVLMRFHLEGRSISEIATKLDISYDAAGQRLSRTREKMKNLVKNSAESRFTG